MAGAGGQRSAWGRTDRRVGRTRRRLKSALMELIDEVGYDAITIRDLTERADVGRSTFYSHYDSKEDLLFAGFDEWLLSLGDDGSSDGAVAGPGFRFSLPLLRHIRERAPFFRATMTRSGSPRVRRRIRDLLAARVTVDLERADGPSRSSRVAGEREARAHAIVGAFLGLVEWWLEEASDRPAEEVDRAFQALVR